MDIAIAIILALHNKKVVLARGRRPGGFIALTLALCFGLELIGCAIGLRIFGAYSGMADETVLLYSALLGLGMLGIGALISYLAARACKPGDYYPQQMPYAPMPGFVPPGAYGAQTYAQPEPSAEPLDVPATVEILRETNMHGETTSWTFTLNGETVGSLGSGASRRTTTGQRQNTLRAVSEDGRECMPLRFNVESGGSASILFSIDRFVPQRCSGIFPLQYAQPAAPFPPYGQPGPPPYGAPNMPPPYDQPGTPPYGQYYAPPYSGERQENRSEQDKTDKPE
jgi:hypothetical protein